MKKIEFISPVEAMRGNLSRTKQTLLYADNDNPAWDAPANKRSYARNYQPIFVGAKVAKSGRKYFAIKTKTAITITPAVKLRMALLAVSSEIANVLDRDLRVIDDLQTLYIANHPVGWSFKRWKMNYIRQGLAEKKAIAFPGYEQLPAIFIKNPYISTTQPSTALDISADFSVELLVKFWMELANNPIVFKVGELTGIAHSGDDFNIVTESNYNNLGLAINSISGKNYVKLGDGFMLYADPASPETTSYVEDGNEVDPDLIYTLTDDAPSA